MRATSSPNTVLQISAIGRLALVIGLLGTTPAGAQVYLPDDPIWSDPDRLDMPAPEPREISDVYDFWANTFGSPADYRGPALNVNTLGEVPNPAGTRIGTTGTA